jgi:hypothetical protein
MTQLSLLLFQRHNKNRRTPGEDAFVVNEVTNSASPEQKMASQLASEPCTADESGARERYAERPPLEPDKEKSFLDTLEQQGARDSASSRLKLELERALSGRRDEFEGRQLPIVGGVKPDLSNGSFAVNGEVAHPPILRSVQESSQREEVEDLLNVVLRQLEKKSQ